MNGWDGAIIDDQKYPRFLESQYRADCVKVDKSRNVKLYNAKHIHKPFGLKPSEISGLTLRPEWQTFIWSILSLKIFGCTQDFLTPKNISPAAHFFRRNLENNCRDQGPASGFLHKLRWRRFWNFARQLKNLNCEGVCWELARKGGFLLHSILMLSGKTDVLLGT